MIKKLFIMQIFVVLTFLLVACGPKGIDIVYQDNTLAEGRVGNQYSVNIDNATGPESITYSVKSEADLPEGLSLLGIVIFGTPLEAGTFEFIIIADAENAKAPVEATFTITITTSNPVLDTIEFEGLVLTDGEVGTAYNATLTASGVADISFTSQNLPAGLTLSSEGVISGTPTSAGTYSFIVTASAVGANPTDASFALVITEQTTTGIVFEGTLLTSGRIGEAYSAIVTASGATGITFVSENVPAGLTLDSNGTISGTPTTAGTFQIVITASADDVASVDAIFSLTIATDVVSEIVFDGTTLTAGTVGSPYSATLTASGVDNITFASSNIPTGLVLSTSGEISGTPTDSGTFYFVVTASATDVDPVDATFAITLNLPVITFEAVTLDSGKVGVSYDAMLTATGTSGITFASSDLPGGLTLDPSGQISGTPTTAGTFHFTVTASANYANPVQRIVTLAIEDAQTVYYYEAEFTDLRGVSGNGWSSTATEWGMVIGEGNEDINPGKGMYIAYFTPPYAHLTFSFTASGDGVGQLVFSMGSEYVKTFGVSELILLNPDILTILINDVELDYSDVPVAGLNYPNDIFNEYVFAETFNIVEGDNTIELIILENDYFPGREGGGPNIDYMKITTEVPIVLNTYLNSVEEVIEERGY